MELKVRMIVLIWSLSVCGDTVIPLPVTTVPLGPTQVRRGTLSDTTLQFRVRELPADTGSLLEGVIVILCTSSV